MQIRFKEYDEKINKYKLLSYINCEDASIPSYYKLFSIMMNENSQLNHIELNVEDIAEAVGESYTIKDVQLVIPTIAGEVIPYLSVEVVPYY